MLLDKCETFIESVISVNISWVSNLKSSYISWFLLNLPCVSGGKSVSVLVSCYTQLYPCNENETEIQSAPRWEERGAQLFLYVVYIKSAYAFTQSLEKAELPSVHSYCQLACSGAQEWRHSASLGIPKRRHKVWTCRAASHPRIDTRVIEATEWWTALGCSKQAVALLTLAEVINGLGTMGPAFTAGHSNTLGPLSRLPCVFRTIWGSLLPIDSGRAGECVHSTGILTVGPWT